MSSFIAEGTNVICTNMTNGSPLKIGLHHTSNVMYKGKNEPLLNSLDKKISDTFNCKNTSKFWSGFATLALGIAAGALIVAAIVVTGGAAGVILAATVAATSTLAAGTAAVAIGAAAVFAVTGAYQTSHACDLTLSSDWIKGTLHDKVLINKNSALLNISMISCKNGGVVSIVLDDEAAVDAAKEISKNNNEEIREHEKSEFFIGMVNGMAFTAFPSLIGVLVGGSIVSYDYWHTQRDRSEDEANHVKKTKEEDIKGVALDNAKYLPTASTGDVTNEYKEIREKRIKNAEHYEEQANETNAEASEMKSQADEFGKTAAEREATGASESSVQSAKLGQDISQRSSEELSEKAGGLAAKSEEAMASSRSAGNILKSVNWKNIGRGFGIGVAAAVTSYFIDDHYYEKEKDLQQETEKAGLEAMESDRKMLEKSKGAGQILSATK